MSIPKKVLGKLPYYSFVSLVCGSVVLLTSVYVKYAKNEFNKQNITDESPVISNMKEYPSRFNANYNKLILKDGSVIEIGEPYNGNSENSSSIPSVKEKLKSLSSKASNKTAESAMAAINEMKNSSDTKLPEDQNIDYTSPDDNDNLNEPVIDASEEMATDIYENNGNKDNGTTSPVIVKVDDPKTTNPGTPEPVEQSPINSDKPISQEPVNPSKPISQEPVNPGDKVNPDPKDPIKPTVPDTNNPVDPAKPTPQDPINPRMPDPEKPRDPSEPTPQEPTNPTLPEPKDPVDPVKPKPENPTNPIIHASDFYIPYEDLGLPQDGLVLVSDFVYKYDVYVPYIFVFGKIEDAMKLGQNICQFGKYKNHKAVNRFTVKKIGIYFQVIFIEKNN